MSTNEKKELPVTEREFLLKLTRSVITADLKNQEFPINPEEVTEALKEERGCFVTLHIGERLRGCIGTHTPCRISLRRRA